LLAQIFLCVDSSIPTAYLLTQFFSSRVGLAAVFSTLEFCFQEQVRLGLNSPASDIFAARAASFLEDVRSLVEAICAAHGGHPCSSFCYWGLTRFSKKSSNGARIFHLGFICS
jgi:hypothetical protein